ncbi:MAG: ABC transporter ATP-binding protein [Pseudomonadota bacterium]
MSVLTVSNLTKRFGGVVAVDGVSFALAAGEFLALIGPNGAGKTTCFNMVNGYLKPDTGSVRLGETELIGKRPRDIWRLGVGRTFQITQTFATMTVRENVQMALMSHHGETRRVFARATTRHVAEAMALLARVGMAEAADQPTATLAYGDVKRLELAVALAHAPKLLLMDEPTAGMAPGERQSLMALTAKIVAEEGVSVLFTEHDMDVVFAHADRILVLNRGALIADGTAATIRNDPLVREVYLGGGTVFGAADA